MLVIKLNVWMFFVEDVEEIVIFYKFGFVSFVLGISEWIVFGFFFYLC